MTLFFITSSGLWSAQIGEEYITFNLVALREGSAGQQGFGMAGIFLDLRGKRVLQFPGLCRREATQPFEYELIFLNEDAARRAFTAGTAGDDHSDLVYAMFIDNHPVVKLLEPILQPG